MGGTSPEKVPYRLGMFLDVDGALVFKTSEIYKPIKNQPSFSPTNVVFITYQLFIITYRLLPPEKGDRQDSVLRVECFCDIIFLSSGNVVRTIQSWNGLMPFLGIRFLQRRITMIECVEDSLCAFGTQGNHCVVYRSLYFIYYSHFLIRKLLGA